MSTNETAAPENANQTVNETQPVVTDAPTADPAESGPADGSATAEPGVAATAAGGTESPPESEGAAPVEAPPPTASAASAAAPYRRYVLDEEITLRDLRDAMLRSELFTVAAGKMTKRKEDQIEADLDARANQADAKNELLQAAGKAPVPFDRDAERRRFHARYTPPLASVPVLELLAAQLKSFGDSPEIQAAFKAKFKQTAREQDCDAVWTSAEPREVTYYELDCLLDKVAVEQAIPNALPVATTVGRRMTALVARDKIPNGHVVRPNYLTTITLLRKDKFIAGGAVEWNTMTGAVEINRRQIDEALLLGKVRLEMGLHYETATKTRTGAEYLPLEPSQAIVEGALAHEALEHSYHPTREWLNALPAWDGQDYLGQLPGLMTATDTTLVRAQLKNFFVGSVARTLDPGCQMDSVLTIVTAKQGTRKSTFFREIAPNGSISSTAIKDFHNKDTLLQMQRFSVVELSEAVGLDKQEDNEIKNFITNRSDDFRVPYGKQTRAHPRHAVLCCSTNKIEFRDPTGSRRFDLVTLSGEIDIAEVRRIAAKLWSQAVAIYRAADTCPDCTLAADTADKRCPVHRWHLGKDLEALRDAVNDDNTVELPCVDWLRRFFHQVKTGTYLPKQGFHPSGKTWAWHDLYEVITSDLVAEMHGALKREDRGEKLQMAAALKELKFTNVQTTAGRVWRAPDWAPKTKELAAYQAELAAKQARSVADEARHLADIEEADRRLRLANVVVLAARMANAQQTSANSTSATNDSTTTDQPSTIDPPAT